MREGHLGGSGERAVPEVRDDVRERLVSFVRTLRADGASVSADASVAAARALSVVGLRDRERVRAALEASLVSERSDLEIFDRHFAAFWYGLRRDLERGDGTDGSGRNEPSSGDDLDAESDGNAREERSETRAQLGELSAKASAYDDGDAVGEREQATYSPGGEGETPVEPDANVGEIDDRDFQAFASALEGIAGRRFERGSGRRPDVRRALRQSVATGGAIAEIPRQRRAVSELSCCLLVDVSRSVLDTIDRGLLVALSDRLHRESRTTRTFFFDAELQEVTEVFERADGDPLAALRAAELSWGGGTRIGDAIATVRRNHPHAIDPDTVVLIVSDGFDVGELDLLEDGMAWLYRRAAGVLWLNPIAGTDDYEPACRGMSRALPFVDGLFPLTESADLAEIGRQVGQRGLDARIGYEYDARRETQ